MATPLLFTALSKATGTRQQTGNEILTEIANYKSIILGELTFNYEEKELTTEETIDFLVYYEETRFEVKDRNGSLVIIGQADIN